MSLKKWISQHIPTPEYMSMTHVGVDISPTSIHVLGITRNGAYLELGKYGQQQLATPVNYSEPLSSDEGLVMALKKVQKKFKLDFVEVSIPEDRAYIFTIDLPFGNEEEIRNNIELHLEENVPITLADAVFDYHIIEKPFTKKTAQQNSSQNSSDTREVKDNRSTSDKKNEIKSQTEIEAATQTETQNQAQIQEQPKSGIETDEASSSQMAVMPDVLSNSLARVSANQPTFFASVSVVPRTLIDQYIELFELCGMVPVSFLVENQALSKAIIKKGVQNTKLIVHVGDNKSVLSVVSEGSVHFTSTVNIGSSDFTAAIMKEMNVSREEAVRMKTERGIATSNQTTIFMSLINTASALKDEIDKIILYWQSYIEKRGHIKSHSIDGLILSGRDALINGFREYLNATVKLPVETADVWSNIYDLENKIPEIDYIDSLDYAVAVGLALPKLED